MSITFEIEEVAPVFKAQKLFAISFALVGTGGGFVERAEASTPATLPDPTTPLGYAYADYLTLCESIATDQGLYTSLTTKIEQAISDAATPPTLPPGPTPVVLTDEQKRTLWMGQIDSTVAAVYSQFTRFQMEYEMREAAAIAFKDSGYVGEPTVWIKIFADNTGISYQACTDLILTQATQLRGAISLLGAYRMNKYKVKNAVTIEEAALEFDTIINDIATLARSL